jgi:hypothetical protein
MEVLPLAQFRPKELLHFFRRVIHDVHRDDQFRKYMDAVIQLRSIEASIESSKFTEARLRIELQNLQKNTRRSCGEKTRWIRDARAALSRGAIRNYDHILRYHSPLPLSDTERMTTRAFQHRDRLYLLRKTFENLAYYSSLSDWDDSTATRAQRIIDTYARPLFQGDTPAEATRDICAYIGKNLELQHAELLRELGSDLPTEAQIEAINLARAEPEVQRLKQAIDDETQRQVDLGHGLERALVECNNPDRPSISHSVRRVLSDEISNPLRWKIAAQLLRADACGIGASARHLLSPPRIC